MEKRHPLGWSPWVGGGLRGSEPEVMLGSRLRLRATPGDVVNEICLQQKFSAREQVFSNEILVGAYSHTIAHTD